MSALPRPKTSTSSHVSAPAVPSLSRSSSPTKRVTRSTSSLLSGAASGSANAPAIFGPVGGSTTTPNGSQSTSATTASVVSPAPVRREQKKGESWSFVEADSDRESHVRIVSSRTHELKLSPTCSWLHQWEHARALHAGVQQGDIKWDSYCYKIPNLQSMIQYLQARLPLGQRMDRPSESLWKEVPIVESIYQVGGAFKAGTLHFTGELTLDSMGNRPVIALCPASAGQGSHLHRKHGSDRFFRLKLDDKIARAGPTTATSDAKTLKLAETVKTFLLHPLLIFGRQYRPFCLKDGAIVYWCESGHGLTTIPLVDFCQQYIDTSLNSSMTVAKWVARFELGLTTTTPTVTFPRSHVFRTPDLLSDTLTISFEAMKHMVSLFRADAAAAECIADGYIPSAIRGSYWSPGAKVERVDMVWRLDYATCPASAASRSRHSPTLEPVGIQARPLGPSRLRPSSLTFTFELKKKDGSSVTTQYRASQRHIEWVEEESAVKGVVMTDGCSIMSFAAMEEVHRLLVAEKGEGEAGSGLPAAAQGRLGPGKGVWALAPDEPWGTINRFIEVRDSQWKFNDARTEVFTFELHSIPSAKSSAKLGKQTFEVLAHAGVPTRLFRELLRTQLELASDTFYDWSDLPKLLFHIEKQTTALDDRISKARLNSNPGALKIEMEDESDRRAEDSGGYVLDGRLDAASGAPNTINELCVEMLQAGFSPDGSQANSSPLLAAKLAWIAEDQVRQNVNFRLSSEQCRTALVVADHLGVLKEAEIFYQSSEPLMHQRRTSHVILGDVLITRPPAVQPCDVQKMTAVFVPEYSTVTDLIIMSSDGGKSGRPACSILSGGDYDGDKLLLISDPAIVSSFDSRRADPKFADPPFADSEWFEVDKRRVEETITPLVRTRDSSSIAQELLGGFFQDVKFGMLSKMHVKLAYTLGLDHPDTSAVGHLFARALDGRKQGLSISAKKWAKMQVKFRASAPAPEWCEYEDGRINADVSGRFASRGQLGKHVMDELVAEGRAAIRKSKGVFSARAAGWVATVDTDLASLWRSEWHLAYHRNETCTTSDPFFVDLSRILSHIKSVFADYKAMRSAWRNAWERRAATEKAMNAPGSPSKASPAKWKGGSSAEQKQELVAITRQFWSLIDEEHVFTSSEFTGPGGAERARRLMASCAYIEPLEPTPARIAPTSVSAAPSLLERFKAVSPIKAPESPIPPPSSFSAMSTSTADAPMEVTAAEPASDEEDYHFSQFDSQIPYTQIAEEALASKPRASRSRLSPVPSAPPSPAKPTTSEPASFATSSGRNWSNAEFPRAGKDSKQTFCLDVAHRDILGLKADAVTARLHGGAAGAKGIQAKKFAPEMADAVSINRRLAGIHKAHSKVRPYTILPEPDPDASSRPSPSKKAKTW